MVFKLVQTAGENCRFLNRNLQRRDFKIVRFSETESEYFLHIDFWTFNFVKRIKAKLHKREFWKERTKIDKFRRHNLSFWIQIAVSSYFL